MNAIELQRQLFVCLCLLLAGFGLLMVHSASVTSWPTEFERVYLSRHLMFLGVGLTLSAIAATQRPFFWYNVAPWLFGITVFLLLIVLVPGLGTRVKGAQRWIRLTGISIQPSELAKIALPLMMCWFVDRNRDRLTHPLWGTLPFIIPIGLTIPLVLIEPDLGTALFLMGGSTLVLLIAGWPLRHFLGGLLAAGPACLSILVMKPYQQRRIISFLETWADFESAPYQLQQSLVSLGAGGLTGVGLGRGWQKLSFLPEANTDFVFAVIGEELGLFGTLGLLTLWCGLYLVGLRMLKHLDPQGFSFIAGFVLLTQVVGQAILNIAVVTAMVPPKGISHPLISVGGSNLMASLLSLAIFVSLSRDRRQSTRLAARSRCEPHVL